MVKKIIIEELRYKLQNKTSEILNKDILTFKSFYLHFNFINQWEVNDFFQDELERTGVNKNMPQFKKLGGMLYNGEFGAGDDNRLNIDKHFASLSHILKEKYLK